MKSLILFYLLILVPVGLLAIGVTTAMLSKDAFVIGLLSYAIIYRPLIAGLRLVALGIIPTSDLWKNYIPFWNRKYFGVLFFNLKYS